jgi:hypothetical protein
MPMLAVAGKQCEPMRWGNFDAPDEKYVTGLRFDGAEPTGPPLREFCVSRCCTVLHCRAFRATDAPSRPPLQRRVQVDGSGASYGQ